MRDRATTLRDLLDEPGRTCLAPADLLEVLVAFDTDDAHDRAALRAFLAREAAAAGDVARAWDAYLERLLPADPGGVRARAESARGLASLARARRSLEAIVASPALAAAAPWAEPCARALDERRAAFERALNDRADGWLDAESPSRVASGTSKGVFDRAPEDPDTTFDRWALDALLPEDRASLAHTVGKPGPWQTAYRAWVRQRARKAHVVAWSPSLSPGFARDEHGEGALEWLRVPLPHLQRDDGGVPCLVVSAHRDGTLWRLPTPSEGVRAVVVPHGATSHRWGDDVTGDVETALAVRIPSDREAREHAVSALAEVAFDEARPVPPEALALARDLARGPFVAALSRGAAAFCNGEEGDDVDEATAWASLALRARILLDRLCPRDEGGLLDLLLDADAALEPSRDALLLLDDDTWRELTRGEALDEDAWWGARAVLPPPSLERLVQATAAPSAKAAVVPVRRATPRREALVLHAASSDLPRPEGFVAEVLLPLVETTRGVGRAARLRIWHDATTGLRGSTKLLAAAGEALHDAFCEARRLCREHARYPWEEHVVAISLLGDEREFAVDGRSLGLAAVLAFVSCWTERPVAAGVAASARLLERRLVAIDHVSVKREALAAALDGAWTLLVHPDDAARAGDPRVRPVATTEEALGAAGLPSPLPAFVSAPGSIAARRAELARLCDAIENQQIAAYADLGIDPWRVLAERVAWLCESLASDGLDDEVGRGRALAALAFVHGGDQASAGAQLKLAPASADDPGVGVLRGIIALSNAIDAQAFPDEFGKDWREAEALSASLDASLPGLRPGELRALYGQALGTQGRALLHAGRAEEALPKLRAAWAHHRERLPREALRSSVYLATALREAGRPLEAIEALGEGAAHLDACRRYSADYAESTMMFWRYEHGRTLLALGDPRGARDELAEALEAAMERGWWPRLGILRALAWAEGMLGRDAARAARLAELERLAAGLAARVQPFARRILAEAQGDPHDAREVY